MRRCLRIKVLGKVQGVSYREFVQKHANKLDVEGTVSNLEDGSILVLACGEAENLDALIDELYTGPTSAQVDNVVAESLGREKKFRGVFRVIGVEQ